MTLRYNNSMSMNMKLSDHAKAAIRNNDLQALETELAHFPVLRIIDESFNELKLICTALKKTQCKSLIVEFKFATQAQLEILADFLKNSTSIQLLSIYIEDPQEYTPDIFSKFSNAAVNHPSLTCLNIPLNAKAAHEILSSPVKLQALTCELGENGSELVKLLAKAELPIKVLKLNGLGFNFNHYDALAQLVTQKHTFNFIHLMISFRANEVPTFLPETRFKMAWGNFISALQNYPNAPNSLCVL